MKHYWKVNTFSFRYNPAEVPYIDHIRRDDKCVWVQTDYNRWGGWENLQ
jgi:hypothetical protein